VSEPEQHVEIPVWFLKLLGAIVGTITVGAIGWVSWVSVNMLEIKAEIGQAAELKARVNFVEKEVVELKLALARLRDQ
jgi:hypothetical protein